VLKSPAIEEALRPLHRLEVQAGEAHKVAMRAFEGGQEARELERLACREVAKRDLKKGATTREEIAEKLAALGDGAGDAEPVRARYIVNDSTVEKLGELLVGNPAGLLLFRDELVAWLRSFDRDGREGDRAFYLEAWNGTGRFTYDRIGRGTIEIPAACVSVFGGIQPGPLLSYLSRYALNGAGDDGLLQRLQVVVWPDTPAEWRNVDRWPDTEAKHGAFETFSRLASLSASVIGAERDEFDDGGVPFLRFDDQAQEAFDAWRAELERTLRKRDNHPAWEAYLAKHRKLIPALALVSHLADGGVGSVPLTAFKRAEIGPNTSNRTPPASTTD
jgi:putative DNA primase/helicase